MGYVVKRLKEENTYETLKDKGELDEYVQTAQELRDEKLHAGTAPTAIRRQVQGPVKAELEEMAERVSTVLLHGALYNMLILEITS